MKRVRYSPPQDYVGILKKYPPLEREEEIQLAIRAKAGDKSAAQKLVTHTLSFAVTRAVQRTHRLIPMDDLIHEGVLGVYRALEKFDPTVGVRFTTYVDYWIRAFMLAAMKRRMSVVKPYSGEVAPPDDSLDLPVAKDTDTTRLELLEDEGPSTEERAIGSDAARKVWRALHGVRAKLKPIDWDIVTLRLCAEEPWTLQRIADRNGTSREWARLRECTLKHLLARSPVLREAA